MIAPSETVLPLLVPSAVGHALKKGLQMQASVFTWGKPLRRLTV